MKPIIHYTAQNLADSPYRAAIRRPPIRLLPTVAPKPNLADSPTEGKNTSRMEKVAAAERARRITSSKLRGLRGITMATTEITRPRTRYLIIFLMSSEISSISEYIYYKQNI